MKSTQRELVLRGSAPFELRIVHVRRGAFDLDDDTFASLVCGRPMLVVVDAPIADLHGASLHGYVEAQKLAMNSCLVLEGGEANKSWAQVDRVCRAAMNCDLPRHGIIVAVGGGAVMDIAGLAAALFRRGVAYVRIPTTLIGLIDAGIGIKHGINHGGRKSILGAFHPPIGVVSDVGFLATLDRQSLIGGVAEIVKVAIVRDRALFELVERHGRSLVDTRFQAPLSAAHRVIARTEALVLEELRGNAYERDLRRRLDFGHTFSPMLEAASGYALSHGEAVALDMLLSTAIAVHVGLCDPADLARIVALYQHVGLPIHRRVVGVTELIAALAAVRRHRGGSLNFVAPTGIGRSRFIQSVGDDSVRFAFDYCLASARAATRPREVA